jgi:Mg2+ and Co2+ transporter CorA
MCICLLRTKQLTRVQVNDLIGLKQQQASVIQAYQAIQQGEETVKQGKAIMLFTVMTIIFVKPIFYMHTLLSINISFQLPLSFMTSVFGMNAIELTGNNTTQPGPRPYQIINFWPTTFLRQLIIMRKFSLKGKV